MSSLAQEESRSSFENVTWGHRKRFEKGILKMAYGNFLGYEKGPDGKPAIVEEEAKTVQMIYDLFLSGKTLRDIKTELESQGRKTGKGNSNWYTSSITSILTNEKYKGDALLQKKFTVDFLQKKLKKNEGEVAQYYVNDSHPGIISKIDFELVQFELERKRNLGKSFSGCSPLASRLYCGDCGGFYGQKVWHSNDKYRKVIWRCNRKFDGNEKCSTTTLSENDIKQKFIEAYALYMKSKPEVVETCKAMLDIVMDCTEINAKIEAVELELEGVIAKERKLINDNATRPIPQDEYNKKYEPLVKEYSKLMNKLDKLKEERDSKKHRTHEVEFFISYLEDAPLELPEWSDKLWLAVCEKAAVNNDGTIAFEFKDSSVIRV